MRVGRLQVHLAEGGISETNTNAIPVRPVSVMSGSRWSQATVVLPAGLQQYLSVAWQLAPIATKVVSRQCSGITVGGAPFPCLKHHVLQQRPVCPSDLGNVPCRTERRNFCMARLASRARAWL
jgi:hypothetical protein